MSEDREQLRITILDFIADPMCEEDEAAWKRHLNTYDELLEEVKRLHEKNRIQRKILDAYSQYRDARYEDCETWMLEKGFRVMVQYGDEEQSEWKAEVNRRVD